MALAAAFARWWQCHMAGRQGRCLIGYSGGLDSTVLLHLASAQVTDRSRLLAVHVHHGLQPAADDFLQHCLETASALKVAFRAERVSVAPQRQGPESAARRARYRAFIEQLAADDVLLLAHHQDDQVETVLLRLLRGSGPRGLAGMPAERRLGTGRLLRPLLDVTRADLLAYAQAQGLCWIEDPSNARADADRNYLRHHVLPALEGRWPAYRRTMTRAARLIAEELHPLALPQAMPRLSQFGESILDLPPLLAQPHTVQARLLRDWLLAAGCQPPPSVRLREFLAQLASAGCDRRPLLQTGSYALRRHGDQLHLTVAAIPVSPSAQLLTSAARLKLPGVGEVQCSGVLTAAATVDFRRGGEYCRLAGRSGHRSLKNLLQERSVPPWWRDRVPLLRIDGEICAVARPGAAEAIAGQPEARLYWLPDPGELPAPQ